MLSAGTILQNRYRTEGLLDMGGTGASYRAWDLDQDRAVKIKEFTPQPGLDATRLKQLRAQFIQEAQLLTQVHHRHLGDVLNFFEHDKNVYLVVDFVEGESLADRIARQGAVPESTVLAWAEQILDALHYYHNLDGIHRDIKPQNIIITQDGNAVLIDFGIIELWDPRDRRTWTAVEVMGTPEYASPERCGLQPGRLDARSDIYSVGATLYYALTGDIPPSAAARMEDPFRFASMYERKPNIRPQTQSVVLQAIEIQRDRRFQEAEEMLFALKYGPPLMDADAKPASLILTRRTPSWVITLCLILSLIALVLLSIDFIFGQSGNTLPTARAPATTPSLSPATAPLQSLAPWVWIVVGGLCIGAAFVALLVYRHRQKLANAALYAPPLIRRKSHWDFRLDLARFLRRLKRGGVAIAIGVGVLLMYWVLRSGVTLTIGVKSDPTPPTSTNVAATPSISVPATETMQPTETQTPVSQASATIAPTPTRPYTQAAILVETFNDNVNNWPITDYEDDWGTVTRAITESMYVWDLSAVQSVGRWCIPDMDPIADFRLTVDAQRISGPEDAAYGLVFRHSEGSYYLFSVREDKHFRFSLWYGYEWVPIVDWTQTLVIRPGEVNRLSVLAQGSRFVLSINDQVVAEAEDEQLEQGEVGLSVLITTPGDALFEFDNFEVREP